MAEIDWHQHRRVRAIAGACGLRGCSACLRAVIPTADAVEVRTGPTGAAYGGLIRCASPWSCSVCSPQLGAMRAPVAERAIVAAQQRGIGAWFLTVTLRHHRGQSLKEVLDDVLGGWRGVWSGRSAQGIYDAGVIGAFRGVEVTHGQAAGWHPHVHAVIIGSEAGARAVLARWLSLCDAVPEAQSLDRIADTDADRRRCAGYATKGPISHDEAREASAELALGAAKRSRYGQTMADVMREAATGKVRASDLLAEYMTATKGRRCWHVAGRRRIEAALDVSCSVADTQEALQALDVAPERPVIVRLSREDWHAIRQARAEREVLLLGANTPEGLQALVAGAFGPFADALARLLTRPSRTPRDGLTAPPSCHHTSGVAFCSGP